MEDNINIITFMEMQVQRVKELVYKIPDSQSILRGNEDILEIGVVTINWNANIIESVVEGLHEASPAGNS